MKTVAILSGGMDSATMLYHLLHQKHEVRAIGFDYGQRHRKELGFAEAMCAMRGVPFVVGDLTAVGALIAGDSALLNPNVPMPEGHYEDESMKATVVPNRNMIMLSVAIGHAIANGCGAVAYGAHSGDHAIYPDCRSEFADALEKVALLCDWTPVKLLRPFVRVDKAAIVSIGDSLGVPYDQTWSCYKGGELHCGKCGTCVERREAFTMAGVDDPTAYEEQE